MAIEIVDFPIKNGDFPWQNVSSPEGTLFENQVSGLEAQAANPFSSAFRTV